MKVNPIVPLTYLFSDMDIARVSIILPVIVLLLVPNMVIFALIIRKRQFRQARFYIIANLTICDSTTLLLVSAIVLRGSIFGTPGTTGNNNFWTWTISLCTHINSLSTTAFLAFDRYVAVKYDIRYYEILTKKKAFIVLVMLWALSAMVSFLPLIRVSTTSDYFRNRVITLTTLRIIVATLLILASKHTNKIRKRHVIEIRKRRINFGVEKEKLDLLQRIKNSIADAFKLYLATIIVMVLDSSVGIFELIISLNIPEMHAFLFFIGTCHRHHSTSIITKGYKKGTKTYKPAFTLLSTKPFAEFGLLVKYVLKKVKHLNDKLNKRLTFPLLDHIRPQTESYPSKSELSISESYTLTKMYFKPKMIINVN